MGAEIDATLGPIAQNRGMSVTWYNSRAPSRGSDWVQKRAGARRQLNLAAAIVAADGGPMICQCTIADISEGGARLIVEEPSKVPDSLVLVLSRGARAPQKQREMARGHGSGCAVCPGLIASAHPRLETLRAASRAAHQTLMCDGCRSLGPIAVSAPVPDE
jgi:hypothetical protein